MPKPKFGIDESLDRFVQDHHLSDKVLLSYYIYIYTL